MIRFGDSVVGLPTTIPLTAAADGQNVAHNLGETIAFAAFYDSSGVHITENAFTNVDVNNITLRIAQAETGTTTFTGDLLLISK